MNLKKLAVLAALTMSFMILNSNATQAATLTVGNATSLPCTGSYSTISAAVAAASPGDTIEVCQGTYDEQVKVTTPNLNIDGAGAGSTIIKPSVALPNSSSLFSGAAIYSIVVVDGVTGVTVQDMTIDGADAAAPLACNTYVGIFYRAASGTVSHTRVTNIFFPAWSGCQGYLGIFVQSGNGGPRLNSDVIIDHNTVDNYGKNGITANEAGTSVTITNNTVTGRGAVIDNAQNGVQLGFGAHGKVTDNNISGHNYTPASYVACGILATNGGGAIGQTKSNTLIANEQNVCNAGGGPSMNSPFNR
jgi:hypothetical protein